MTTVVGVDLGGTNITAALVAADHSVSGRTKVPTPGGGPDAVLKAIVEAVRDVADEPSAVGVGAPGPVHDGVVVTAPNLPGWGDPVPLEDRLVDALRVPVAVANDASVGTYGEWAAGAGMGGRCVLGVWLGTGVGGGLVIDGRLHDGPYGGAGELGHMIVRQGGRVCGCGRRGCVEAYAGRASLEARVAEEIDAGAESRLPKWRKAKGKDRITSGVWAKALEADDPVAVRLVADAVDALGAALGSVINLLDCDLLLFGGGLTEKLGQPFVDRIAEATRPWVLAPDVPRRYVAATLEDDAGIVGAAALARALLA